MQRRGHLKRPPNVPACQDVSVGIIVYGERNRSPAAAKFSPHIAHARSVIELSPLLFGLANDAAATIGGKRLIIGEPFNFQLTY